MIALLDVNVLIALFDRAHEHHDVAHEWLDQNRAQGWATCPVTLNGCMRILAGASYPGRLPVAELVQRLRRATDAPDHYFWSDAMNPVNNPFIVWERVLTTKHVTDLYLLSLAMKNGGLLATFDRSIPLAAMPKTADDHLVVLHPGGPTQLG